MKCNSTEWNFKERAYALQNFLTVLLNVTLVTVIIFRMIIKEKKMMTVHVISIHARAYLKFARAFAWICDVNTPSQKSRR